MTYRRPMTRQIAAAASMDAGNRSMRAAGRAKWSMADREAAIAEFMRLMEGSDEA